MWFVWARNSSLIAIANWFGPACIQLLTVSMAMRNCCSVSGPWQVTIWMFVSSVLQRAHLSVSRALHLCNTVPTGPILAICFVRLFLCCPEHIADVRRTISHLMKLIWSSRICKRAIQKDFPSSIHLELYIVVFISEVTGTASKVRSHVSPSPIVVRIGGRPAIT